MNGWKRIAIVASLVTGLTASLCQAQDFKSTVGWMHNTAAYDGGGYHVGDKTIMDETEVPLTNTCQNFIIIQTTHYWTKEQKPDSVWKVSFSLAAIDPKKIEFNLVRGEKENKGKTWAYVWIGTTNDEDAIKTQMVPFSDSMTAGVDLFFNDTDFADRFSKALKHAVLLCGGKASAF